MNLHRTLTVWQLAHALRIRVFHLTRGRPQREADRLVAQVRSSSASIADNIAEGRNSGSDANYLRYLKIASASSGEVDSQLMGLLGSELLPPAVVYELLDELAVIRRMLLSLEKTVKNRLPRPPL